MTEEDTFQAAMDADPENTELYLIFADFLGERDDPREAGYREMGRLKLAPRHGGSTPGGDAVGECWEWWRPGTQNHHVGLIYSNSKLPEEWFDKVEGGVLYGIPPCSKDFLTRREACDAAALAFLLIGCTCPIPVPTLTIPPMEAAMFAAPENPDSHLRHSDRRSFETEQQRRRRQRPPRKL